MNRLILLFLLFTASSTTLYSCDCDLMDSLKVYQMHGWKNSDVILLGEVIRYDENNGYYEVSVIETYKGDIRKNVITGVVDDSCDRLLEFGTWLIYGDLDEGKLRVGLCSISRSFLSPIPYTKDLRLPFPRDTDHLSPMKLVKQKIKETEVYFRIHLRALEELNKEISWLRYKRDN